MASNPHCSYCDEVSAWVRQDPITRTIIHYCKKHSAILFPTLGEVVVTTEELLASRRAVYGDIRDNANCQAELKAVMRRYWLLPVNAFANGHTDAVAHMECLEYVLEKLSRIITGPVVQPDSYDDMCGYATLAKKIAMGESTAP